MSAPSQGIESFLIGRMLIIPLYNQGMIKRFYSASIGIYSCQVEYMGRTEAEVIIVGAGPVGLLLGNLLGQANVDTIIVEKRGQISQTSRAIGITPPSLEILAQLGLDTEFIAQGIPIREAIVHGQKQILGRLSFASIPSPYQFILSFPQRRTEEILTAHLGRYPTVRLERNHECTDVAEDSYGVTCSVRKKNGTTRMRAGYLCACDGFHSTVRGLTGVPLHGRTFADTFLMGDYLDRSDLGSEAHLFFTPRGSVESFPMPSRMRRWVVQTEEYLANPDPGYLESLVRDRSGFAVNPSDKQWESPFRIYSKIAPRFYRGRILFLGDAAHTIAPIGGQGMNSGIADAELAAFVLGSLLSEKPESSLLRLYHRRRRRAANTAARRAILSMKTGTIRGTVLSAVRNGLLTALLASPFSRTLAKHYAMLTIPHRNLGTLTGRHSSQPE